MKPNVDLTKELMELLLAGGADLAGAGELSILPDAVRYGLPIGISVAMKYPKDIIRGISELPTKEYRRWYDLLNEQLDRLVTVGAEFLQKRGYRAIANTRERVENHDESCQTALPHKTIATRAGLGWIGKCALLVTEEYGSMIRLSSILTDAPLAVSEPIEQSRCGNCSICQDACPGGAVHGAIWKPSMGRDELFDYRTCRETALSRSERGFGKRDTLCGKCIEVCPYTKRYLAELSVEDIWEIEKGQ